MKTWPRLALHKSSNITSETTFLFRSMITRYCNETTGNGWKVIQWAHKPLEGLEIGGKDSTLRNTKYKN